MECRYRIGEFAELSGVTAKTLRFYDEIGLLRPAGVDPRTRYRQYVPEQLQALASIQAMKSLGVPLAEIRHFIGQAESADGRRRFLCDLKETVQRSMQSAMQTLSWIDLALAELNHGAKPLAVVVKRRPAVHIASLRGKLKSYAEVDRLERDLRRELPAEAVGSLRGVLWHRCADSGLLEGEAFVSLRYPVPRRSFYEQRQLAAATLACAYAQASDDSWEQTYSGLQAWMKARGYRLAGPKREIYIDPLLEIQFPMQSS
jgi:DNA-binding transcriptional MerR regulator